MLLTLPPISGMGNDEAGLESLRLSPRECDPDLRLDELEDELGGVELPPLLLPLLLTPAGKFPFCSNMRWHRDSVAYRRSPSAFRPFYFLIRFHLGFGEAQALPSIVFLRSCLP